MKECIFCRKVVDCIKENRLCFKTVLGEYWLYKGPDYVLTVAEDKQCPIEQDCLNMCKILDGVPDGFESVYDVIQWCIEHTTGVPTEYGYQILVKQAEEKHPPGR